MSFQAFSLSSSTYKVLKSKAVYLLLSVDEDQTSEDDSSVSEDNKNKLLGNPLYKGSNKTLREVIQGYIKIFLDKSMSKSALTDMLTLTKSILPHDNLLPSTYQQLKSLISDELVRLQKLQVCVNDCLLFKGQHHKLRNCPHCGEERYKSPDGLGRIVARRYFTYCSLESSLQLMFGCSNVAQVIQEAGGCQQMNVVSDITESKTWRTWKSHHNGNDGVKVALGFNTDGVNPYHSQGIQYSFWPLIFCIMNLSKRIRNKGDALILAGVVPSKDVKLNKGLEPDITAYMELVVDELLTLSSMELYSAYQRAPVAVKVEVLLYMMDFQAYSKFFRMSGCSAYFTCNICLMKATRLERECSKMALLGHNSYQQVKRRDYNSEVNLSM